MWFCFDFCGFRWISWIRGVESLSTCGDVKSRAVTPLTNLYSDARVGRLEAWMPGYLVFRWIYVVLPGFRWF